MFPRKLTGNFNIQAKERQESSSESEVDFNKELIFMPPSRILPLMILINISSAACFNHINNIISSDHSAAVPADHLL